MKLNLCKLLPIPLPLGKERVRSLSQKDEIGELDVEA